MEDKDNTIGLSELLAEVDRDLDEFRKKHPNDYSVKNISLWWELERALIMTRHASFTVVKKLRRAQSMKRLMIWFFAGWVTSVALSVIGRLLVP